MNFCFTGLWNALQFPATCVPVFLNAHIPSPPVQPHDSVHALLLSLITGSIWSPPEHVHQESPTMLPVGVQIIGPEGGDLWTLACAELLEKNGAVQSRLPASI